jgi:nicotinamide mononucleotide transporter
MSPLELIAAALGLINIVLIARRTVLNYPFGIAMVLLYAVLFAQTRLYSAALLQLFFLGSQLYGWWYWRRGHPGAGPVPVRRLPRTGWLWLFGAGAIGTAVLGLAMSRFTDAAAPWLDAGNAAWSMVAQLLTDRRYTESWPLWVAIDALSIWLYASQGLFATAALYAVFLLVCLWGWIAWARAEPAR